MTKITIHARRYWPIYAIGVADILILAFAHRYLTPAGRSFEWPAWMQAVGSISAILVAIWVSSDQTKQQRAHDVARQREELDGVLRSIRAEVFTTLVYLGSQVAPAIRDVEPGKPIRTIFSLPEYPFPIFDGLIPKLGMIPDKRLLHDIIATYAYAKSLAMTAGTHNGLVEELAAAETRARAEPLDGFADVSRSRARIALRLYGEKLETSFTVAYSELQALEQALIIACPDE